MSYDDLDGLFEQMDKDHQRSGPDARIIDHLHAQRHRWLNHFDHKAMIPHPEPTAYLPGLSLHNERWAWIN